MAVGIWAQVGTRGEGGDAGTEGSDLPAASPNSIEPQAPTKPLEPPAVRRIVIAAGVEMEFCWIPPGEAQMGSTREEQEYVMTSAFGGARPGGLDDEAEVRRGRFATAGFWLGRYEVTQAEWTAVMGNNPSKFDGRRNNPAKGMDARRFPVDNVSWTDCQRFLEEVNRRTGDLARVFGLSGRFTLPHEDEWEYACRGGRGNRQPFYWGNEMNGWQANLNGKDPYGTKTPGPYLDRTAEVGAYAAVTPHPWGLCDMHGNVWEWCQNKFEEGGELYVVRGGAWHDVGFAARAACRGRNGPSNPINYGGGLRVCFRRG